MPVVHLTKTQEREARVERVLRIALADQCTNQRELARKTKRKYCTVNKRINEPGTITLYELWDFLDELNVPPEERSKIVM